MKGSHAVSFRHELPSLTRAQASTTSRPRSDKPILSQRAERNTLTNQLKSSNDGRPGSPNLPLKRPARSHPVDMRFPYPYADFHESP